MGNRKAVVSATLMTVVAVGVLCLWSAQSGYGAVVMQFVPIQEGAPVSIAAVEFTAPGAGELRITLRRAPEVRVMGVGISVNAESPGHKWFEPLTVSDQISDDGKSVSVKATCPMLADKKLNARYGRGVLLTFGLDTLRLANGTVWQARRRNGSFVSDKSPESVSHENLLRSVPLWQRIGGRRFWNALAKYPINGSLKERGCVMTACGRGVCEFNGCSIW